MDRNRSGRWALAATLALGIALGGPVAPAGAAMTAPALSLSSARATTADGGVLLRVEGEIATRDLVQHALAIHVLVRPLDAGGRFLTFELPTGAFEGADPGAAGPVDAAVVETVLSVMAPAADARLLEIGPHRIDLLLPASFPAGPAEAVLFMVYEGDVLLSNPVAFSIEGGQP
jgi:hypothetical protein